MPPDFRSVDFYYNAQIEKHICRHFASSTKAGGTFLEDITNVAQLLALVDESTLVEKKTQGRMRSCLVFEHHREIGRLGIGLRTQYDAGLIQQEMRDGIMIDFVNVEQLPTTNVFTLVCTWEKGRWQLITAYPGPAGEPFPHPKWDAQQNEQSERFWSRYVLLKLKKD